MRKIVLGFVKFIVKLFKIQNSELFISSYQAVLHNQLIIEEKKKVVVTVVGQTVLDKSYFLTLSVEELQRAKNEYYVKTLNAFTAMVEKNELIRWSKTEDKERIHLKAELDVLIQPSNMDFDQVFGMKYRGFMQDYGLGPMAIEVTVSDDWFKRDYPVEYEQAVKANRKNQGGSGLPESAK